MFDIAQFITQFFKMPQPVHYREWVKVYSAMAVHTKKVVPSELLLKRRPNETEEVFNYRLCNYKPITYGSMNRATDELYRIVSSINYVLNCNDKTKSLMNETLFGGFSFTMYLQQVVLRRMIEDPNGILVWLPGGSGLTDSSEKAIPRPLMICSQDIHYRDEDVLAFLSYEKSVVKVGKTEEHTGNVYYILTKDSFYKLRQVGRKAENTYQSELIYEHNIGEIPAITLGGDKNDEGFYDSFFAPYLAFGDEAICQFSDWQAIMVTSTHPIREEFAAECFLEEVHNRSVTTDERGNPIDTGEEEYRPKKFVLKPMHKSPYGTILRRPKKGEENVFDEAILSPEIPSVRFISPDISVAKYAGEAWEKLIAMAEDSLHLNLGRGDISGTAKEIDKESQKSMLLKIGNNFFDNIFYNSVVYIDAYHRFTSADRKGITIDKPATYDFKSEEDIADEISMLKEKKAPSFFLANASIDLAKKRFSGDKLQQKIFTVIQLRDPLYIYSVEEKNQMVLSGYITKNQCTDSVLIYTLLMNIASEMTPSAFIQADNKVIIAKFDAAIAPYYETGLMPLVDSNGQS